MAVVSVKEIHDGRDGDSEGKSYRGVYRFTRVFRVVTNSNTDDAATVQGGLYSVAGVRLGSAHPSVSTAYCQRISPRNESFSKTVWIVTCAYSTESELAENPLNIPAEIEWTTEQFTRPYFKDRDGNAIMNSAGDYYDPPVDGDDSRWVAHVTKNLLSVQPWILTYRDATNSDAFSLDGVLIPVGAAKLMELRISKWQEMNNVNFRTVSTTIAVDENGWAAILLDQGLRQIGSVSTARIKIYDSNGEPVDSPVPLDGAGKKLSNPSPSTAVFRTHHIYKSKPFSVLPLW